jgi:hypothetical protein
MWHLRKEPKEDLDEEEKDVFGDGHWRSEGGRWTLGGHWMVCNCTGDNRKGKMLISANCPDRRTFPVSGKVATNLNIICF